MKTQDDEIRDWAGDLIRRWILALLLFGIILLGSALLGGCASESVSKSDAVQATGIAAAVTAATTTVATGGWSLLVGFFAGLARILFAQSSTTPASVTNPGGSVPWFWIVALVVVWLKWRHILDFITGQSPRFDALLRTLGLRTHKKPIPIKWERRKSP